MMIDKKTSLLMQVAYECVLNTKAALDGYRENENISVSLQFMNQAYLCAKQVQDRLHQINDPDQYFRVEQFYHQFLMVNQEFLESLETDHSLQHSYLELETLEKTYEDIKVWLAS